MRAAQHVIVRRDDQVVGEALRASASNRSYICFQPSHIGDFEVVGAVLDLGWRNKSP